MNNMETKNPRYNKIAYFEQEVECRTVHFMRVGNNMGFVWEHNGKYIGSYVTIHFETLTDPKEEDIEVHWKLLLEYSAVSILSVLEEEKSKND